MIEFFRKKAIFLLSLPARPSPNYYVQLINEKFENGLYKSGRAFVCSAPLQGAILLYGNGTSVYYNVMETTLPRCCHPQEKFKVEYFREYNYAACILVRMNKAD